MTDSGGNNYYDGDSDSDILYFIFLYGQKKQFELNLKAETILKTKRRRSLNKPFSKALGEPSDKNARPLIPSHYQ